MIFHQFWWHFQWVNCHQFWWLKTHQFLQITKIFTKIGDKKNKIGRNYCHQNWWHFRHSKTHQFLQFTKNVTKIGEKFGENSIENSNHQNFRQNWWTFWRKFNRKWMRAPTSSFLLQRNCYGGREAQIKCVSPLVILEVQQTLDGVSADSGLDEVDQFCPKDRLNNFGETAASNYKQLLFSKQTLDDTIWKSILSRRWSEKHYCV